MRAVICAGIVTAGSHATKSQMQCAPIAAPKSKDRTMPINKTKAIITSFDCPPIPDRGFDWSARFEWHDGDDEDAPIGVGATQPLAVLDLLTKGAEHDDDDGSIIEQIVEYAIVGALQDLAVPKPWWGDEL